MLSDGWTPGTNLLLAPTKNNVEWIINEKVLQQIHFLNPYDIIGVALWIMFKDSLDSLFYLQKVTLNMNTLG